jgi:hypothetical protein
MRGLTALLGAAVAVSVVHYVDNVVNYDAFPQFEDGPTVSRGLVAFAWFFFTAFGIAGYLLFRRGREQAAAIALAVYSGSGLVGILHYAAPGMTDAVWWRQAHVIADIVLGFAVLAFALRTVSASGRARSRAPGVR